MESGRSSQKQNSRVGSIQIGPFGSTSPNLNLGLRLPPVLPKTESTQANKNSGCDVKSHQSVTDTFLSKQGLPFALSCCPNLVPCPPLPSHDHARRVLVAPSCWSAGLRGIALPLLGLDLVTSRITRLTSCLWGVSGLYVCKESPLKIGRAH